LRLEGRAVHPARLSLSGFRVPINDAGTLKSGALP
jgi:hypothetical protein